MPGISAVDRTVYSPSREQRQDFLKILILVAIIFVVGEASVIARFSPAVSWVTGTVFLVLFICVSPTGFGSTVVESTGIRIRWSPLPSRMFLWGEIGAVEFNTSGTGFFGSTRTLVIRTKSGRSHKLAGIEDSLRRSDPALKDKHQEIVRAWKRHT